MKKRKIYTLIYFLVGVEIMFAASLILFSILKIDRAIHNSLLVANFYAGGLLSSWDRKAENIKERITCAASYSIPLMVILMVMNGLVLKDPDWHFYPLLITIPAGIGNFFGYNKGKFRK